VIAPTKIADVAPAYPAIARAAGVQGTVLLQATIGLDGRVEDLQVLRSVPLLDQAAVTAVRQWRYTPTLLNGQPVAVVMTVTVGFRLR
jgi:protein TonB